MLEKQEGKWGGKGQDEGLPCAMGLWRPVLPFPGLCPCCQPRSAPFSLLQAKESIEQLVYLCQTDKEPVREAAKQSLMLCGECSTAALGSLPSHGILSGIS